ncbi:gluconate 2-dehydrogenase subunit 3 family protein [Roseomonas gilardii]|uniref:gluconate 2-dehydrogenase subunit 3 family protein n=1 Tax=Roseomonas gilardii TaxID=257708 RepID=UPI0011AAADC7|nr:gluconate 2-dehydrogenase subunit 3 family protein [Roseomonas gilardii]
MRGGLTRRRALLSASALVALGATGQAREIRGLLPWQPGEVWPPETMARPGPWLFLTADEAAVIEVIAERMIPTDSLGPGGRDAGCPIFIDRQLAGPYGRRDGWYMQGPFPTDPLPTQGYQLPFTPRQIYRQGLAALARHVATSFSNRRFQDLGAEDQDKLLTGLEKGEVKLDGFDGKVLFEQIYGNVMEGYFADPIYGGNKGMVGWRMIGFPGARYDFRDVIAHPNQRYTIPPVGLMGRPEWGGPGGPPITAGSGGRI